MLDILNNYYNYKVLTVNMICSLRKKRRRVESVADTEASCKRCNCKKSKCLKLYCECFAAGVYCVEPCSCQDCFNKPIHEDTVLATRKQIESHNPLAFAPKAINTSDPLQEDAIAKNLDASRNIVNAIRVVFDVPSTADVKDARIHLVVRMVFWK